ncbi:zf-HC2 domain-containing protein [candidate division WOR-3 bacterium]|nr:zf-HC2 domain-containing protein [candidate division WOR-3 bacterium]
MKHNKFDDLIQSFIDGELTRDEEKTLKEHIRHCKECQKKLRYKEKITALIRESKEDVDPPMDLARTILTRTSGRKIYRINWKHLAIGAAAILILSLILFIHSTRFKIPLALDVEKDRIPRVEPYEMKDEEIKKPQDKGIEIPTEEREIKKQEEVTIVEKKPLKEFFGETRLIFPEEGSVVGDIFDVVIILKESGIKVELNIDGEKRIFESNDSNVLFIQSDSLPVLENGIHYMSLVEPTQQSITFFKEG